MRKWRRGDCVVRGKIVNKSNGKKRKKNQLTLIVLRIGRDGTLQNSRPCSSCIRLLRQTGNIRKIMYSLNSEGFMIENIFKMEERYDSVGTRTNHRGVKKAKHEGPNRNVGRSS